jgi:hypothetical protein
VSLLLKSVEPGDCVRIDIPNRDDPYFQNHGKRGEIIEILRDDAGAFTGDERKSYFYRVRLASGTQADLRWRDLPEQPQS